MATLPDPRLKACLQQQLQQTRARAVAVSAEAGRLATSVIQLQAQVDEMERAEGEEKERVQLAIQQERQQIVDMQGDSLVRGTKIWASGNISWVLMKDGRMVFAGSMYPGYPSNGFARIIHEGVPNGSLVVALSPHFDGATAVLSRGTHIAHLLGDYERNGQQVELPMEAAVEQLTWLNRGLVVRYSNGTVLLQNWTPGELWRRLPFEVCITQVATSEHNLLALGVDGKVYAVGSNRNSQFGTPPSNTGDAGAIQTLDLPERARFVTITESNSAVIGVSGKLYITGSGVSRAGMGEHGFLDTIRGFQHVVTEGSVAAVALGSFHSMILLEDGRVFGCGKNRRGELGHPMRPGFSSMSDTDDPEDGTGYVGQRSRPIHVPLPGKAAQVACGSSHTLVLMENGDVLAFGSNMYGQMGVNELPARRPLGDSKEFTSLGENLHPVPVPMRFW